MSEKKKLTTEEILALARQKKAEAAAAAASPPASAGEGSAPAAPEAAEPHSASAAPKSTADILAAARAQAAAKKAAEPAAPAAAPAAAPKSTADILAAARGQGAKPAATSVTPKSTADILAAARAKAGAAPAAASKPAASTQAPAAAASGDKPPLKEMVAAVRAAQTGQPAVATRPVAEAKPKLPVKKAEAVSRRSAFSMITAVALTPFMVAWAAMAAVAGLMGLATARFMMPNMVLELPSRFKVGPPSEFPRGVVSEKYKASRGVWIVRSSQYDGNDLIYALASVCTHLGCTPNWLEGEQKFKCPCHGSGFYITGINFEGPAPRPLERVGIRLAEDGSLEVDKSVKFQEELGQWSDGKSFYQMT